MKHVAQSSEPALASRAFAVVADVCFLVFVFVCVCAVCHAHVCV